MNDQPENSPYKRHRLWKLAAALPLGLWLVSVVAIHGWLIYSDRPLPPGWTEVRLGDSFDRVTELVGRPLSDNPEEMIQTYLRDVPSRERIKTWGRRLLGIGPTSLRDDVIFTRFDSNKRLRQVEGTGIVLPPR